MKARTSAGLQPPSPKIQAKPKAARESCRNWELLRACHVLGSEGAHPEHLRCEPNRAWHLAAQLPR